MEYAFFKTCSMLVNTSMPAIRTQAVNSIISLQWASWGRKSPVTGLLVQQFFLRDHQRKNQGSRLLKGIHQWSADSPHKGPVIFNVLTPSCFASQSIYYTDMLGTNDILVFSRYICYTMPTKQDDLQAQCWLHNINISFKASKASSLSYVMKDF